MLASQLAIFGLLATFTKNFTLSESSNNMYSISYLLAATRLLLALSYARGKHTRQNTLATSRLTLSSVLFYLPRNVPEALRQRRRIFIHIVVFTMSSFFFIVVFFSVHFLSAASWTVLYLWYGCIVAEVAVYFCVPDVDGKLLLNVDPKVMGDRLSGLTTIILGEGMSNLPPHNLGEALTLCLLSDLGLNGVTTALVGAVHKVGFNVLVGGVAASAESVILLAFLLVCLRPISHS